MEVIANGHVYVMPTGFLKWQLTVMILIASQPATALQVLSLSLYKE